MITQRLLPMSCLLAITLLATAASAQSGQPIQVEEGRIDRMIYHPSKVYKIRTRIGSFTNIEVPPGEQIEGFYLSDTMHWQFIVAKDLARVLVKPSQVGTINSGTLVTNKRVYELSFVAVPHGEPWQQKVQWDETREEIQAWGIFELAFHAFSGSGVTPITTTSAQPGGKVSTPRQAEIDNGVTVDAKRLHFGWQIEGDPQFRPIAVFDDGHYTYMRLPKIQDLPALFTEDAGRLQPVDYMVKGEMLIVPQVNDALVLRLGQHKVRVMRRGIHSQ